MKTVVHRDHFADGNAFPVYAPTNPAPRVVKALGAVEKVIRGWVIQVAANMAIDRGINVTKITPTFAENVLVDLPWPFDAMEIERRIAADLDEMRGR